MVDKISTVSKQKLHKRIEQLSDQGLVRVNGAVLLGLAGGKSR